MGPILDYNVEVVPATNNPDDLFNLDPETRTIKLSEIIFSEIEALAEESGKPVIEVTEHFINAMLVKAATEQPKEQENEQPTV